MIFTDSVFQSGRKKHQWNFGARVLLAQIAFEALDVPIASHRRRPLDLDRLSLANA